MNETPNQPTTNHSAIHLTAGDRAELNFSTSPDGESIDFLLRFSGEASEFALLLDAGSDQAEEVEIGVQKICEYLAGLG